MEPEQVPVSMASSSRQRISTYHFRKVVRVTRLETRSASVIGQGQLWNSMSKTTVTPGLFKEIHRLYCC